MDFVSPLVSRSPGRAGHAVAACALALWSAGAGAAQLAGSEWDFSGFGTLGVASHSGAPGWGMHRSVSQRGASASTTAAEDSRLGLQINWNRGERWDAAFQAVALNRPQGAPLQEAVEWAYVGLRTDGGTRIRAGRVTLDMFLFADSRNVGYALPWVRPPMNFYSFVPQASLDGLDVSHQWSSADVTWRARAAVGAFSGSAGASNGKSSQVRGNPSLMLTASREADGLQIKGSYLRTSLRLDYGPEYDALKHAVAGLAQSPVPGVAQQVQPLMSGLWSAGTIHYLGLGLQYEKGPWSIQAEGSQLIANGSLLTSQRAYASVGYRVAKGVTAYGLVSRVRPLKRPVETPDLQGALAPVLGPAAAAQAQAMAQYAARAGNMSIQNESTVGLGVRWDFAPNAALKFQVDRIRVHPNGGALWMQGNLEGRRITLATLALDFVWGQ